MKQITALKFGTSQQLSKLSLDKISSTMFTKFSLAFIFFMLIFSSSLFSQDILVNVTKQDQSSLSVLLQTNQSGLIKNANGKRVIDYSAGLDESSPGKPILPSKTIIVAIPPNATVMVNLKEKKETSISNVTLNFNPVVYLDKDSLVGYRESGISDLYLISDAFPSKQIEILDYVWIRDFYCAIIKINPVQFYWKSKSVTILESAEIEISFNNIKPFNVISSQLGDFDKGLADIIINFNSSLNFRSKDKPTSIQNSTDSWIDYSKIHYKLGVVRDGIYRITYYDLFSYGISPSSLNPKSIKIFRKGEQLPLYIKGEDDLSFDENDYIEFWCEKNYGPSDYKNIVNTGQDYINYMDRYSDTSMVWLTFGGEDGLRIINIPSPQIITADTLKSYYSTQHFEKDVRLWYYDAEDPRTQLPFWQEHKVFTWLTIGNTGSQSFIFNASDFIPNTPVKITTRLISNAGDAITNAHKHGSSLNSTIPQDTITFDYRQTVNFTTFFNSSQLITGNNTYRVFGLPSDGTFHRSLIDWVDINYYRELKSQNDSLIFYIPDSVSYDLRNIRITNLLASDSLIILYKISSNPKKITEFNYSGGNLVFSDSVKGGDKFIITKSDYILSPTFKYSKTFVNLRDVSRGADYIIVSNKLLMNSAEQYRQFIFDNYNLRTQLIYIDDIYDEFAFGQNWAESIKGFLYYANQNWTAPAPSYLNLIGDANYDYKDIWSPAPSPRKKNLVPSYGYPVSDIWYTTWDSTNLDIPQMYVGRFPANTNVEVLSYLNKHSIYLTRRSDDWNKRYTFYSGGDPTKPSELAQIKAANDSLNNNLIKPNPVAGKSIHFYKTINPPTNFGPYTLQEYNNAVDSSGIFISYIGHSGTRTWDNGVTEVEYIQNAFPDRYPLISDFGCSTGKFAEPDVDAFGELFVAQSSYGQAIGYLGNSSLGFFSTSLRFPGLFYKRILIDSVFTISKAHVLAKIDQFNLYGYNTVNRVFSYCNVLFTDPILKFAVPQKPNFIINQNAVSITPSSISDLVDSVLVDLKIMNWGKVITDSVKISITHFYSDSILFVHNYTIPCPSYSDNLEFYVNTERLVGLHRLSIILDPENLVDEIYEDDNNIDYSFQVYSSSIRPVETEYFYSTMRDSLRFLNPAYKIEGGPEDFIFSLADNQEFSNANETQYPFSQLFSKISLSSLTLNQRYWYRARLNSPQADWSSTYSFKNNDRNFSWFIDKDFNANDLNTTHVVFDSSESSWKLSRNTNYLTITSAGSNDGKFASMIFNTLEYLPNTFFWGIATAEIDSITLEPGNIKYFAAPNTITQNADSLINYVNLLPLGKLIALAISDDAAQTVLGFGGGTPVRRAIETLGSLYIDSVRYRESWCLLGKKGAPVGSVPESYKKLFQGAAIVDTSKLVVYDEGSITFPQIGNSAGWLNVFLNDSIPDGAILNILPLGIRDNNQIDTLDVLTFSNDSSSIQFIDPNIYPKIKLQAELFANQFKESPSISSIGVNYNLPAELAINYQVVSLDKDSVYQGGDITINFDIYNVGYSPADSFNISLELVKSDKNVILLLDTLVNNLNPTQKLSLSRIYTSNITDGYGDMKFRIKIDYLDRVVEIYKDNNLFDKSFFVIKDTTITSVDETSVSATFDGIDIVDGDYISSSPEILIKLNYPLWFPIDDTTAIQIYLDNNLISYSDFNIEYDTVNRIALHKFSTSLVDGEHSLRVFGKDVNGLISSNPGFEKVFVVSGEFKILNPYNYPNPFSDDTYFTFTLTTLPEELKISIYTIAGRKIKEIKKTFADLNVGFNKISWNGRDQDGDIIANGTYLYKIIIKNSDGTSQVTQKLSKVK
ncbi:MAG: T9SS type A sorting domain-containing protein [Ignavibacteriales bacterium]|nr:T9SS type A sorting domain-containing protein [Ignavibacteriales bacterium]